MLRKGLSEINWNLISDFTKFVNNKICFFSFGSRKRLLHFWRKFKLYVSTTSYNWWCLVTWITLFVQKCHHRNDVYCTSKLEHRCVISFSTFLAYFFFFRFLILSLDSLVAWRIPKILFYISGPIELISNQVSVLSGLDILVVVPWYRKKAKLQL